MNTNIRRWIVCLVACVLAGAAGVAGQYSRLDYGAGAQGKYYSPNAPRLFVEGEAFVSFLKFSETKSTWEIPVSPPVIMGWLKDGSTTKTKMGGGFSFGGNLASMGVPLKIGVSYRYLGKASLSDSGAGVINGGSIWDRAVGHRTKKADVHSFTAYGTFDFAKPDARFRPFLTARAGTSLIRGKGSEWMFFWDDMGYQHTQFHQADSFSKWAFTYGLGAGVGYDLTNNLRADLGYEYVATSKIKLGWELPRKMKVSGHIIKVGLGWTF